MGMHQPVESDMVPPIAKGRTTAGDVEHFKTTNDVNHFRLAQYWFVHMNRFGSTWAYKVPPEVSAIAGTVFFCPKCRRSPGPSIMLYANREVCFFIGAINAEDAERVARNMIQGAPGEW